MFVYKIDVLKELKKKGYTQRVIRRDRLLSQCTVTSLRNGEMVGIHALDKICSLLGKRIGVVIEHKK